MRLLRLKRIKKRRPLILLGLGNMGKSMLRGWLRQGIDPEAVRIISPRAPEQAQEFKEIPFIAFKTSVDQLDDYESEVVVMAVKPQKMDDILEPCRRFSPCGAFFISLAAGKSLNYFRNGLGDVPIIRTMPNTPSSIGYGMTVAVPNNFVTLDHRELCTSLLESVGSCEWIENEDQMDAITALSGSGPAYIFLLAESMAAAGIIAGLDPKLATKLAIQTIYGAANLLNHEQSKNPLELMVAEKLRKQVTSPNGTTYEALKILMSEQGMNDLMVRAIYAATNRSRELGGKGFLPSLKGPFPGPKL